MTELLETLKKAVKTSKEVFETALDYVEHWSDSEYDGYEIHYNEKESEKWLSSDLVASEWDKREKEHASFLETARKELKIAYADLMFEVGEIKGFADALYTQNLISKPKYAAVLETVLNLTKKMKIMLAVFGGEGK